MTDLYPFHYAFKVKDLPSTRKFYIDILGCREGRSTDHWVDFDFFGHQLSAHVSELMADLDYCGRVDNIRVPIPHFGCLLSLEAFSQVREKIEAAKIPFVVSPQVRYPGKVGEQHTLFVLDFSNNPLEFKAFTRPEEIFASHHE